MKIIKLCQKDLCTGCKACAQICPRHCISFEEDFEGFEYPNINIEQCIQCAQCMKVCPILTPAQETNNVSPKTIFIYSKDNKIIKKSSSGGFFSIVANFIFEHDGIVIGASMEDYSLKVSHTAISDSKELYKLQGSKYVQSDTNTIYSQTKELLNNNKIVLFTGTPCQIGGLYNYLKKDYPNLYTLDLICHGVPSFKFFRTYVEKLNRKKRIKSFSFRNTKNWNFDTSILEEDKRFYLVNEKDFYMKSFLKGETFRDSCYKCQFAKLPRTGDITIGDFWGINEFSHQLKANKYGNSVILLNNKKGEDLFHLISSQCHHEEVDIKYAIKRNHNIYEASIRPQCRNTIYKDMFSLDLKTLAKKYNHTYSLRNYLGFIKRYIINLTIK